jgi:hypothetical protein
MSDDDEDYNSSDESNNSEDEGAFNKTKLNTIKKPTSTGIVGRGGGATGGGPKVLTLEDVDDDTNEFQRPDFTDFEEGEGEDEDEDDEIEGEYDDDPNYDKRNKKQNNNKKSKNLRRSDSEDALAKSNKSKKQKKKRQIGICVTNTKYECVRRVGRKLGFREVEENEDWTLFWTDTSVSIDRVNQMKRWQKINHYPGMSEICRKDFLTRNMNRMAKLYPKDYTFYPKAWCLPAE